MFGSRCIEAFGDCAACGRVSTTNICANPVNNSTMVKDPPERAMFARITLIFGSLLRVLHLRGARRVTMAYVCSRGFSCGCRKESVVVSVAVSVSE